MARECAFCAVILAIFCPPLAVLMMEGSGMDLLINLLLTALGWLPRLIHALFVIARPEPECVITVQEGEYMPVQVAAPIIYIQD